MKKMGFTLVELIAVIAIIGVIGVLSFAGISSMLESNKEKEYERFLDNLYVTVENYISVEDDVRKEMNEVGTVFVNISDLEKDGYITSELINPKTESEALDTDTIKVVKENDGTYSYEFYNLDITTDGYINSNLVMLLDGYNEPKNGIWSDLSISGNNGETVGFEGDEWKKSSVYFDGVDDKVVIPSIISDVAGTGLLSTTKDFSLQIYFDMDSTENPEKGNLFGAFAWSGMGIGRNQSAQIKIFTRTNTQLMEWNVTDINIGTKYFITMTYDATTKDVKFYLNNNYLGEYKLEGDAVRNDAVLSIFSNEIFSGSTWPTYVTGNVYTAMVYDDVLTSEEVVNNFNVVNDRFGE